VCPIPKKGNSKKPIDYRPVSGTCVACRVMETVVKDQMMGYAMYRNLIHEEQHGFMPGRSTLTNLISTLDKITIELDRVNGYAILANLDYAKAFDKVVHPKLLGKLYGLGYRGKLLIWLAALLTDRLQQVRVNSCLSEPVEVTSGVPQGSVTGPFEFVCYINDSFDEVLFAGLKLFADDSKLYICSAKHTVEELREDLDRVMQWAEKWQLSLAIGKCSVLHLGTARDRVEEPIEMAGIELESVTSVKDLGVVMQQHPRFGLCFEKHIASISARSTRMISLYFRTFTIRARDFYFELFEKKILPLLQYNCQVWFPHLLQDIDRIENVQRYFLRRVAGLSAETRDLELDYPQRLNFFGWVSLEERRIYMDLCFAFKILNGNTVLRAEDLFEFSQRGHSRKLRRPISRHEVRHHFFTCRVVNVWNSLSDEILFARSFSVFKSKLRVLLSERFFKRFCRGRLIGLKRPCGS
jgi:hypothetical protein